LPAWGVRWAAALLGAGLLLAGCAPNWVEPDADRAGRTFVDAVQRADWQAMDKALGPRLMGDPDHAARIEQVRGLFPSDPPWSIKLLKSSRSASWGRPKDAPEHSTLQYLYGFANRSLVIDLALDQAGQKTVIDRQALAAGQDPKKIVKLYQVTDLQVRVADPASVAANRFFAPHKTALQWGFLGATFAVPLVMLAAAVAAARAPGLTWRPAWMLLALVGVGSVWMNWTTGSVGQVWAAVNVLGFGIVRGPSPLDPWMLRFASPVGTLAVVVRLVVLARSRGRT
jgi:hypothetical protein